MRAIPPPLGFIVEGHGEYEAYPSLVARICDGAPIHIPRINAGGSGNVVGRLEEHLDDMVMSWHPRVIVVTLDLCDLLEDGRVADCADLCRRIASIATVWLTARANSPHHGPLPERIVPVIQIPEFESWLVADPEGLILAGILPETTDERPTWVNVDEDVQKPTKWLRERCGADLGIKSPAVVKQLVRRLDPDRMASASRSFRKFVKEVRLGYREWIELLSV